MPAERFTVRVAKDYLVFCCGHFITYNGDDCERLHGHNYRAAVQVEGECRSCRPALPVIDGALAAALGQEAKKGDACDFWVGAQKPGDDHSIGHRAFGADMDRFQRPQHQPAGVGVEMIAPGGAQHFQVSDQILATADAARQQIAVPAAIFGQRGHAQVNAMFERSLRKRAEQGVVNHDQRAVALLLTDGIRNPDHQVEIDDGGGRVGGGFRDDQLQRPQRHRRVRCGADIRLVGPVEIGRCMRPELRHYAVVEHIDAAIDWATVQHAVAGADMGQRNARMRGHAAAEGDRIFRPVNRRQPAFQYVEARVAKPRINMIGLPDQRAFIVEKGCMYVLGMLGRGIDEGRGHEDRRLDRSHAHVGVITVGDGKGFRAPARRAISRHGRQCRRAHGRNTSR